MLGPLASGRSAVGLREAQCGGMASSFRGGGDGPGHWAGIRQWPTSSLCPPSGRPPAGGAVWEPLGPVWASSWVQWALQGTSPRERGRGPGQGPSCQPPYGPCPPLGSDSVSLGPGERRCSLWPTADVPALARAGGQWCPLPLSMGNSSLSPTFLDAIAGSIF